MKRYISAITAIALCAGVILTVRSAEPTTISAADNAPKYTVTIPASVSLGETAVITASDLSLSDGDTVSVLLSGTGEADNAFRLHNGEHELLYTVTQNGNALTVGDTVLSVPFGATAKSAELAFVLATRRPYPGAYTGNVAFTISTSHAERQTVAIPGIGYIRATADSKDVAVHLYNPEDNPCLFAYEIVLNDTKETLWKSEQNLAPGESIRKITLAHPLEAGTYPATLIVTALTMDGQSRMNGSDIEFEIRVKEG